VKLQIGYISEYDQEYSKELWNCKTLEELKVFIERWKEIAYDGYLVIFFGGKDGNSISLAEFEEFRRGLRKEHSGRFSGEDWVMRYGAVVMPEMLMRVAMISHHFKVPWGTAFIRCHEEGYIVQNDDHYEWKKEISE